MTGTGIAALFSGKRQHFTLERDQAIDFNLNPIAVALLFVAAQLSAVAYAETPKSPAGIAVAQVSLPFKEDKAQLKEDEAVLKREEKQWQTDQKTLKADTREGKMAAESKDAERVYKDKQFIQGERKDIAADKPGSLQKTSDMAALKREEKKLRADRESLKADNREGRMAAESRDAEIVYQDKQAIKGERMDIVADMAKLKADQKN